MKRSFSRVALLWVVGFHCLLISTMTHALQNTAHPSSFDAVCRSPDATFESPPHHFVSTVLLQVCNAQVKVKQEHVLPHLHTETTTITVASPIVASLPTRVWRLNHWFDWVRAISQGPGKAAPVNTDLHRIKSLHAQWVSTKKSWRSSHTQQRRSVMASARSHCASA
jgi:hypothetical protein